MKSNFLKITPLFFIILVMASCSLNDDEDEMIVTAPSITYTSTNATATFFEEGNSSAPNITWNGNQGTISLNSNIEGLSINSTTGVLNWNKLLQPGEYSVEIVATNSAGQTAVNYALNNPLQGTFTGTYSGSEFFEVQFNLDGTLKVRANSTVDPDTGSGTWQLIDGSLTGDYMYDDGLGEEYSISGTINQSSTQAIYSGNWHFEYGSDPNNIGGEIELVLE